MSDKNTVWVVLKHWTEGDELVGVYSSQGNMLEIYPEFKFRDRTPLNNSPKLEYLYYTEVELNRVITD